MDDGVLGVRLGVYWSSSDEHSLLADVGRFRDLLRHPYPLESPSPTVG